MAPAVGGAGGRGRRAALLLEAGADKALVCNNGKTALQYAEQSGNDAVVALLRD